jgi:hypothetical protein
MRKKLLQPKRKLEKKIEHPLFNITTIQPLKAQSH